MAEHEEKQQLLHDRIEELIEEDNRQQLRELLAEQHPGDIADIVEMFNDEQRRLVFDLMGADFSAEVIEKSDEATRADIFDILKSEEVGSIIAELSPEDAADVLGEFEEEQSEQLLAKLEPANSAQIRKLMKYSEDSAGGIMDPLVLSVPEEATVSEAIAQIRQANIDEDFYSVFVINSKGQFLGDLRLRYLLTSKADTKVKQLVDTNAFYVTADTDQEDVRNFFRKNDLIVVPVVDQLHRLVGRITADRVIEVAEEEAAEDIYTMAGTDPDELEKASIFRAARIRMTWLLPCLIGTAVTAFVALSFKGIFINAELFYIYATAFAFAPMIAAISGNAGLQTSAIVVSGLATGHLADLSLKKVFSREVRIAVLVALTCAFLGSMVCSFLPGILDPGTFSGSGAKEPVTFAEQRRIATAFGFAMFSAIMVATTLGLFLPFVFRKISVDPAISSGPLVTTANDSISVAIYMLLTLLLVR